MTDNGAAMLAGETRNGPIRLGIEHKTTWIFLKIYSFQADLWFEMPAELPFACTRLR